jgi:hypothetical protein
VPRRITLADSKIWENTLRAFGEHSAGPVDAERAASQLLLDIGLWLNHYYDRKEASPFANLAKLTCNATEASLRIAHCLRAVAFGDAPSYEMHRLLTSGDSGVRQLLEEAHWVYRSKAKAPRVARRKEK